jgi:uncharacterized protein (DUF58 family)
MSKRDDIFDQNFLALLERLHLLAKRLAGGPAAGQRRSRRLGDGLEFADHRDYAAGDDIRFINWPYYARMEKLLLRLFHEHSDQGVFILLDCSASMGTGKGHGGTPKSAWGWSGVRAPSQTPPSGLGGATLRKFDYARRTAAALAYVAMGGLERVVVQPFAEDLAAPLHTGRNRAQILTVLDYLAALEPGGKTDLRRCVERLVARQDFGGSVLILSDLLDCGDPLSDALARLRSRCDPTVIHLFGPEDADPAVSGQVQLQHAETAQEMNLDVTPELLESYRLRWQEFCQACEHAVHSRGGTYVSAPTSLPFEKLVLGALRKAGVLQ